MPTELHFQVFDDFARHRAIAEEYLSDAELDLATITGVVVALMCYSSRRLGDVGHSVD